MGSELSMFSRLMATLPVSGPYPVWELLAPPDAASHTTVALEDRKLWAPFLRAWAHDLAQRGAIGLLQCAIGESDASPITRAAEAWLADNEPGETWLRRLSRPAEMGRPTRVLTLLGHTDEIRALAVDSSGERLLSAGYEPGIRVWDLRTGEHLGTVLSDFQMIRFLAIHPDSRRVVLAGWGPEGMGVGVADLEDDALLRHLAIRDHSAVYLHPDGDHILVAGDRGMPISAWAFESDEISRTFEGHSGRVTAIAAHPDGHRTVSGDEDGEVRIWDFETGRCDCILPMDTMAIRALLIHPDGRRLLAQGGQCLLWDLQTGERLGQIRGVGDAPVAIIPGGERLLAGLGVHDLGTGELVASLGPFSHVKVAAVRPHGGEVVTAGLDRAVQVWQPTALKPRSVAEPPAELRSLKRRIQPRHRPSPVLELRDEWITVRLQHGVLEGWHVETGARWRTPGGSGVRVRGLLPHGRSAILQTEVGDIQLCDLENGTVLGPLGEGSEHLVTVMPDGRRALLLNKAGDLTLWDTEGPRRLPGFSARAGDVEEINLEHALLLARNPHGAVVFWDLESGERTIEIDTPTAGASPRWLGPLQQRAAFTTDDERLLVYDLTTGSLLAEGPFPSRAALVARHPDGCRELYQELFRTVQLWDTSTGECLEVKGSTEWVFDIAVPRPCRYVSAANTGLIGVWDLEGLREVWQIDESIPPRFYPSVQRAVSGHADGSVRISQLDTGTCLETWSAHDGPVAKLAAAFDAGLLVSVGGRGVGDGQLKVWDLATKDCLASVAVDMYVHDVAISPAGYVAYSDNYDQRAEVFRLAGY